MSTKFFTNEAENTLINKIEGIFKHRNIHFFDALVGYFRASGYFRIRKFIERASEIRILVGINIDNLINEASQQGLLFDPNAEKAQNEFFKEIKKSIQEAEYDKDGNKIADGKNVKFQFGAAVKMHFKKDIAKNVNLETTLELFSDYLYKPENVIINWNVIIDMSINSWLSAKLSTELVYDDNITINDNDGNPLGPRTQFKEMFGLGLAVKF